MDKIEFIKSTDSYHPDNVGEFEEGSYDSDGHEEVEEKKSHEDPEATTTATTTTKTTTPSTKIQYDLGMLSLEDWELKTIINSMRDQVSGSRLRLESAKEKAASCTDSLGSISMVSSHDSVAFVYWNTQPGSKAYEGRVLIIDPKGRIVSLFYGKDKPVVMSPSLGWRVEIRYTGVEYS